MNMHTLALVACGIISAFVFKHLAIPGGYMLGALVGSALYKIIFSDAASAIALPSSLYTCAQIVLGISIGAMFSLGTIIELKSQLTVMFISTGVLILVSVLLAIVVNKAVGLDPINSVLATSPGGITAVIGMASTGAQLPMVVAFQTIRLYTIHLLIPLCCWVITLFGNKH